jgi:hypothetical protein
LSLHQHRAIESSKVLVFLLVESLSLFLEALHEDLFRFNLTLVEIFDIQVRDENRLLGRHLLFLLLTFRALFFFIKPSGKCSFLQVNKPAYSWLTHIQFRILYVDGDTLQERVVRGWLQFICLPFRKAECFVDLTVQPLDVLSFVELSFKSASQALIHISVLLLEA